MGPSNHHSTGAANDLGASGHNSTETGLPSEGIASAGTPPVQPLQNVISLLRLCIAGVNADLTSDVTMTVVMAIERLTAWAKEYGLDQPDELETGRVYGALDVLALVETVLYGDLQPAMNGVTGSPVCGALELVVELVEALVGRLQPEIAP